MEYQLSRFDCFVSDVEKIDLNKNMIIMGNFNINLCDTEDFGNNSELKDNLLDRFPLLGLTQTVRKPSRHCSNSISTLIDHSWVSNMKKFISTKNVESTSDHDLIITSVKTKGNVNISEKTYSRNLNRLNIE